ncbi:hypothetical protein HDV00_000109 [Rhizophlyctis rosea]|nr:hypothetical protein HDV00_000109 [Rhizophlyctis rosea]
MSSEQVAVEPLSFPSADEELLFSFLNQDYIAEPHSSPSYSSASYEPDGPPSPTMLFDTLTTCSSPPHISSPPATTWSTESGTDSDGDNGKTGKGSLSPFLMSDQLHDVPISAEDLQALIGLDGTIPVGANTGSAVVTGVETAKAVGQGTPSIAAPSRPAETLDVSAVLNSQTAELCQQLLTEPNRRKPGRKKKTELPDIINLPPGTEFHVPIKKEEDDSSTPTATPVTLNFIPQPSFQFLVPKQEDLPTISPATATPIATPLPTFIQIPAIPTLVPTTAPPTPPASLTSPPQSQDPAALAAAKRHERMIKNREAADQSRKRKREHLQLLETHAQQLIKENELLKRKVLELEQRNAMLMGENERLRKGGVAMDGGFRLPMDAVGVPPASMVGVGGGAKRKATDTLLEQPHNKKAAVGAVFMVFLFSFAMLFFPGANRPHLGGHIAGKAFSPYNLDHAVAARRYIEASPYYQSSTLGSSSPSSSELVPFSLPSQTVDSTYLNLPLDGNFTELLDVLAGDEGLSRRGRAQIAQLRAIFKQQEEQKGRGGAAGQGQAGGKRLSRRVGGVAGRTIGKGDVIRTGDMIQNQNEPIHLGPLDWYTPSTTPIPSVAMSDLLRLMPYGYPFSISAQQSSASGPQCRRICTDASGRLIDEAMSGEYPRLSLLASLPGGPSGDMGWEGAGGLGVGGDGTEGREGLVGGFLQLDLEVIDAKLVKWNGTGKGRE